MKLKLFEKIEIMAKNNLFLIVIVFFLGCMNIEKSRDEITLDEYITTLNLDFTGGYLQDGQLESQYNGKKYSVEPVDTLEDLGCIVYQVRSDFVDLLVLKSIASGKYYSIYHFKGYEYPKCSNSFLSNIQESVTGLEFFLNEKPIIDIRTCSSDIEWLFKYYKGLNSDNKIDSWSSLDSLLNAESFHLNDTEEYMVKNIFDVDNCFSFSRYKPELVNVYYQGAIYIFCIFKDAPMVLPDGRYIVWIRSIRANKNKYGM